MNSGSDVFKKLGVLVHVGQTEFEAGLGAGQRFKDAGVKNGVCFNQEVGNQALTLRCNGFFKGLTGSDTPGKILTGKISDPAGMQSTIAAAIQSDPTIDGILTLGPSVAKPALDAVTASGKKVHLATFDLSADVLTAIKDGKMDFAIDQQQYLQGYLPIVILTNYAETKNLPTGNGEGLIMTGPGFVTQKDAARRDRARRQGSALDPQPAQRGALRRDRRAPVPPPNRRDRWRPRRPRLPPRRGRIGSDSCR
jgi:simple sugar transport system substrate-binding protein